MWGEWLSNVGQVLIGPRPVDEDAAVGPNAAADERERRSLDQRCLPRLERDPAQMLLPGSMLRQETGEVLVIQPQRDHSVPVSEHSPTRLRGKHRRRSASVSSTISE